MSEQYDQPTERPELGFVPAAATRRIEGEGVVWWSGISADSTECEEFEYGRGVLDPGASSRVTPENRFSETYDEAAAVVTAGEASVIVDGTARSLSGYDALYVPPGGDYAFENSGREPVEFVWVAASVPNHAIEDPPFDHCGVPQVVETLREVDPVVTVKEGHRKRFWFSVSPATVGSRAFNVTVIRRPPGSVAPLHEHAPPTRTEGFTVTTGRMLTTDQAGREYLLEPGDFLYVPAFGMHENKSVYTDDMVYVCVGYPGRTSEVTADIEDTWYEGDD